MSAAPRPPRLARRLLQWALPDDRRDDITGDLDELFGRRRQTQGIAQARRWYWREAVSFSSRFLAERILERRHEATASRRTAPRVRPAGLGLRSSVSSLDVKLGLRMLIKYPGLTLVSTVALAIAIAIVAGFHAGTQSLVRPTLPVPDGDRVVAIWQHDTASGERGSLTLGDMLTWREEIETLDDVGAFSMQERLVAVGNGARFLRTAEISPSVFPMLRVAPALGRSFVEDDARAGPPVALIGFDFWQSALDGDTDIVGRTIRVSGVPHTVVGVMPSGFAFPRGEELWTPLSAPAALATPGSGPAIDFAVARLAEGATLEEAEAELQVAGARTATAFPEGRQRLRPRISSYARSFVESQEPGLLLMLQAARTAIGIVLLVVAVNVGTLVYARNAARLGEIAVRMAMGASRRRIALQMFVESLVLGTVAAAVGVALLLWPLHVLQDTFDAASAQGDAIPYWFDFGFGPDTALVVVGLVLLSAVLTGVLPALKLTDRNLRARLQRVQEGSSGLRFGRSMTFVVVSQVALSVALLLIGGAQLRTFVEDWWSQQDRGANAADHLMAELRWDPGSEPAGGAREGSAARRAETSRELARRAALESGVAGTSFASFQGVQYFASETEPAPALGSDWSYVTAIEPGYFDVQMTPVLAGRRFDTSDRMGDATRVAIVNDAFVRARLPRGDPIGQRVRPVDPRAGEPTGDWLRIVGVVPDTPSLEISHRGPAWVARSAVYVPLRDSALGAGARMHVRAREEPARLVGRLQALASELDPSLILHRPRTVEEAERVGLALVGLYGLAVGFFVFAALLLSATGVYAMMSFTVTQRTREIGIRTALGAPARRVVGDIFSRAIVQLGWGTALGLALGYLAADGPFALSGGLFADGPGVIFGVAAMILALGLVACGRPMRRALRIEPTEALRSDG